MPAKNTVKTYVEGGYYHIYNRGVEKRQIFQDKKDNKTFLNILKTALSPPPHPDKLKKIITIKGSTFEGMPTLPKNFHHEITLLAYCLMPNHFHLLIKQSNKDSIKSFMQSIGTRYSMYFNKRYKRKGSLFQGIYKAVIIENDNQLLHLSRYIHQNPHQFWEKSLSQYPYSSYAEYLGLRKTTWIKPKEIITFFITRRKTNTTDFLSYESFVETTDESSKEVLLELTLEGSTFEG